MGRYLAESGVYLVNWENQKLAKKAREIVKYCTFKTSVCVYLFAKKKSIINK